MTVVAVLAVVAVVDVWPSGLSKPSLGQISHYTMAVVAIIGGRSCRACFTLLSWPSYMSGRVDEWTSRRADERTR